MGIDLRPYLVGQPYRLCHLRRALSHICQHRDAIWITQAGSIFGFLVESDTTITSSQPALKRLPAAFRQLRAHLELKRWRTAFAGGAFMLVTVSSSMLAEQGCCQRRPRSTDGSVVPSPH
ncbi:hypothetical protein [Qingshengfaniella alkalisoli]|uniref:hypothetical protein n=1 Tax=Qingshengfaniella alkalisoli TaxID=2599296 RepID=UPI001F115117|nr:hypothetical protein [Qingshengfaniella alkalisoli]